MQTITIKKEMNFDDLYQNSWSGALDTLDEIVKKNKEEEFMEFLSMEYMDREPEETELNDFIWFDDNYIFKNIGINNPYGEEELEEEDSE